MIGRKQKRVKEKHVKRRRGRKKELKGGTSAEEGRRRWGKKRKRCQKDGMGREEEGRMGRGMKTRC